MSTEIPWWTWLSPAGFATNLGLWVSGTVTETTTGVNPWEKFGLTPPALPDAFTPLRDIGLMVLPYVVIIIVVIIALALLWKIGIPWLLKTIAGEIL